MGMLETVLFYAYFPLFCFAVFAWFKLSQTMQLFKFKVMQKIFYMMLIASTYVTFWTFAEILLRVTGIKETAWHDAFMQLALALLLAVFLIITKTLEDHRQELLKFDSLYYKT